MPSRNKRITAAIALALLAPLTALAAGRVNDAYQPPDDGSGSSLGQIYEQAPGGGGATTNGGDVYYPPRDPGRANTYSTPPANGGSRGYYGGAPAAGGNGAYRPPSSGGYSPGPAPAPSGYDQGGGYGEPYHSPGQDATGRPDYGPGPRREYSDGPPQGGGTYSKNEIMSAGHNFFGSVSQGLANVVEYAFQRSGRPNGYVLGEDAGGAFVAGLRYGEGVLYTKDAGSHKVYWQGPSLGYDFGAEGSKTMVLVYNLRDPSEIYNRFGGIQGSAYIVGGVSIQFQQYGDVVLAPIRSGVGLRLGANVGYLKYTRNPTWNPF